jgi:hypothetical protein
MRSRRLRVLNLLIRRLVRAVRGWSVEAVGHVELPARSAASRCRSTSWVHEGYMRAGLSTPCLQIVQTVDVTWSGLGVDEHEAALRHLLWTGRVARVWPKTASHEPSAFSARGDQPCGCGGAPPTISISTMMSSSVETSMRCGTRARVTGEDVPSRRMTRTRHWDRAASSRASSTRRPMSWRLTASARLRPGAIQASRRSTIS